MVQPFCFHACFCEKLVWNTELNHCIWCWWTWWIWRRFQTFLISSCFSIHSGGPPPNNSDHHHQIFHRLHKASQWSFSSHVLGTDISPTSIPTMKKIAELPCTYQFVKTLTKSNLVHGWSSTFAGQRCATCHWHIRNVRRTAMYSADGKARICYASRFAHVASRFIIVI